MGIIFISAQILFLDKLGAFRCVVLIEVAVYVDIGRYGAGCQRKRICRGANVDCDIVVGLIVVSLEITRDLKQVVRREVVNNVLAVAFRVNESIRAVVAPE